MKQVEVTILGQGYLLGCPDGGETLLADAVSHVDREMSAIRDSGKVKARERIAVLAALNLAYQLAERRLQPTVPAGTATTREARTDPGTAAGGEADVDVDALVRRIDAVLGSDGHLL